MSRGWEARTLFEALQRQVRRDNRIARLLRESRLPLEKNLAAFDRKRLPHRVNQHAAIGRLVHHSVILELNLASYRLEGIEEEQRQWSLRVNSTNMPQRMLMLRDARQLASG